MATVGLLGTVLSSIAASYCSKITQLIGTQGVLLGIFGSIAFCPLLVYADQWFDKRKGLALGIIASGAGFGGLFLPLILNALLDSVGFRQTMCIWASVVFLLGVPLTWFVRPRVPPAYTEKKQFWNFRAICSRFFVLTWVANFIQGSGYYVVGIYAPTFAQEVFKASHWLSTVSLMLLNLTAMIGLITMGQFTDMWSSRTCIAISALGATVAVFLFWGLAVDIAVLYVFCIVFGLFSGGFPAVWPAIMRETEIRSEERGFGPVDGAMVYSLLSVGRGLGNIVSGPISAALVYRQPWKGDAIGGYGSGFGALIVFCGLTCLLSGMNTAWYHRL